MDSIKSPRFILAVLAMGITAAAMFLGKITGGEGVAYVMGLATGAAAVVGSAAVKNGVKALLPLALVGAMLSGCVTTSTGERKFDAAKAVDTACAITPALSTIAQKGVCENLAEPARTKCLRIAAIVQASAGVGLAIGGSIAEACKVPQ
jgi:folate-dependent tRNA-U54 methylase TrmFO/GidA